uniref:Low-density lipoprotein receptor-related protein 2-like n=1 Tax=Phallusia mammillata TaxID=59560 RepID=A0A6F9DKI9_9ASCI|nr:low-density lipoprotein receptor-related protein 2-like [Phallusia mammillata]
MKQYQICRNVSSDFCPENLKSTSSAALRYVNKSQPTYFTSKNCSFVWGLKKCITRQRTNHNDYEMNKVSPLVWAMAIITISGNSIIIFHGIKAFRKGFAVRSKVEKIYNILILNLSFADLLMGFYLLVRCIMLNEDKPQWRSYKDSRCTAIGVVNFVSSQVSVTILIIITTCRLFSVLWPYRTISVRVVVSAICINWLLWSFISIIPLLNIKTFSGECNTYMRRQWIKHVAERFANASSEMCGNNTLPSRYNFTDDCLIAANIFVKRECSREMSTFYNRFQACSMQFFFDSFGDPWVPFTLTILTFNCLAFIYMLVAYCLIYRNVKHSTHCSCSSDICGNFRKCLCGSEEETQREVEDRRMQRRIFFIVCTDFLCWVPVSLIAFFHPAFTSTDNYWTSKPYLSIFIILILPLNSAINPILYSTFVMSKCCGQKEKSSQDLSVEMAQRDVNSSQRRSQYAETSL